MKKMNGVCMVTGSFLPEITGAGLQCSSLLGALPENKREYLVITTLRDSSLSREEEKPWGNIYRVYINPASAFSKIACVFKILKIFLRIKNRIGVIHLHGFSSKSMVFVALARLFKKKIVIKLTSLGDDDPLSVERRRFGRIQYEFYKRADVYISVSPGITAAFKASRLKNRPLQEIPNGVDTNRFSPVGSKEEKDRLRFKLRLPIDKKIIITVGFFSLDKGIDLLYDSWKKLINEYRADPYLLVVGAKNSDYFEISHSLVNFIQDDIKKNSLADRIGLIEKAQNIEDYFRASDIFMMSSRREGLSNALLEAMSCALPVVVNRISGVTDHFISHEIDGLLFERDDIKTLADNLFFLLQNPQRAANLGVNARKKIMEKFLISDVANTYDKLYEQLI